MEPSALNEKKDENETKVTETRILYNGDGRGQTEFAMNIKQVVLGITSLAGIMKENGVRDGSGILI